MFIYELGTDRTSPAGLRANDIKFRGLVFAHVITPVQNKYVLDRLHPISHTCFIGSLYKK